MYFSDAWYAWQCLFPARFSVEPGLTSFAASGSSADFRLEFRRNFSWRCFRDYWMQSFLLKSSRHHFVAAKKELVHSPTPQIEIFRNFLTTSFPREKSLEILLFRIYTPRSVRSAIKNSLHKITHSTKLNMLSRKMRYFLILKKSDEIQSPVNPATFAMRAKPTSNLLIIIRNFLCVVQNSLIGFQPVLMSFWSLLTIYMRTEPSACLFVTQLVK